jgi:hypothetical protein
MKLTSRELKNQYGLDLPVGKFQVKPVGDHYEIYSVLDDTEGCVLTAEKLVGGTALNSRKAYARLFSILENDLKASDVWLSVL